MRLRVGPARRWKPAPLIDLMAEHPFLASDRDEWAEVLPSASEAHGHLEAADVERGEYRASLLEGRVAEAAVINGRVTLRGAEQRDLRCHGDGVGGGAPTGRTWGNRPLPTRG
jgi:hypothetical protein